MESRFDPKGLLKDIDYATLSKVAQKLKTDQILGKTLRQIFKEHSSDEGFKEDVEKLSDKIQDLFKHDDGTPK